MQLGDGGIFVLGIFFLEQELYIILRRRNIVMKSGTWFEQVQPGTDGNAFLANWWAAKFASHLTNSMLKEEKFLLSSRISIRIGMIAARWSARVCQRFTRFWELARPINKFKLMDIRMYSHIRFNVEEDHVLENVDEDPADLSMLMKWHRFLHVIDSLSCTPQSRN